MVLRFLSVKAVRHGTLIQLRQGDAQGCNQCDPLISRSKQHVILEPGILDGMGVRPTQPGQTFTVIKQPSVEKIGADSA